MSPARCRYCRELVPQSVAVRIDKRSIAHARCYQSAVAEGITGPPVRSTSGRSAKAKPPPAAPAEAAPPAPRTPSDICRREPPPGLALASAMRARGVPDDRIADALDLHSTPLPRGERRWTADVVGRLFRTS